MQQLLTGKRRFRGFDEDWRLIKLNEVFLLRSGDTKPQDTCNVPDSEHQYSVYGGNGILGYSADTNSEAIAIVIDIVGLQGLSVNPAGLLIMLYTLSISMRVSIRCF